MDFCKGKTSGCSCPQCDQEPTPQLAAGHVGNKFSDANFHVVFHVGMTESSNSHPKGSIRSRRYGSSALHGHVENESVTGPTSSAWGDGGHRCRSFPCPICHGRACNNFSSLKIGENNVEIYWSCAFLSPSCLKIRSIIAKRFSAESVGASSVHLQDTAIWRLDQARRYG